MRFDGEFVGFEDAGTFDLTGYGAVGDDKTDNTAAFTARLNDVIATGGGKMVLPDGVYRGRIIIPPQGGPGWITIEIVGESEPAPVFGAIGSFPPQNHGTYRNTHHLTVTGKHGFMIAQMNTEQPGEGQTNPRNAWQTLVSDVNDPDNLGIGDINYWVVIGGVGAVDTFTKNDGTGIRARRIGSAPWARRPRTSHGANAPLRPPDILEAIPYRPLDWKLSMQPALPYFFRVPPPWPK